MKPLVIEKMYAFVADNTIEGEGVMGFNPDGKSWMPMVGADMERVYGLLPIAERVGKAMGFTWKILEFSNREDITSEVKNGTYKKG